MKEKIDLTIKPTMGCNLRCKHCFNGDAFVPTEVLDVKIACELLEKACKEYHSVKVIFHGGEPSLVGKDFYKNFFEVQRQLGHRYGTVFNTLFTTNGVLLDDEFIDLLNANDVLINVSFDGPYNSVLRQQTDRVLENIYKIRDKGGRFRCFCTLSKASVAHLKEIYDWFKVNNLNFKTLPIERRGYAESNTDIIMAPQELVENFKSVYKFWVKDKECRISYSTFEEFANLRRDAQHRKFWFGRKIALNPDGRLYVFGRPNDVNYEIGRPSEIERLSDCFESEEYREYLKILESLRQRRCHNCESKVVCGGVNINIAYLYVDDLSLVDYSCKQSNMLFQAILNINDEIEADIKNGYQDRYNEFIKKVFLNER